MAAASHRPTLIPATYSCAALGALAGGSATSATCKRGISGEVDAWAALRRQHALASMPARPLAVATTSAGTSLCVWACGE